MSRAARLKFDAGGWYHVYASAAAHRGEFPLAGSGCSEKLVAIWRHYASAYFCGVSAFCVMGNHYHVVLRFDQPHRVEPTELRRRADILYPGKEETLDGWSTDKWNAFEARLFDLSELMRNVQGTFSRWYNSTTDRKGSFWAERFRSTLLEDERAALTCMSYVELNPIRASLVKKPEKFKGSSMYLRDIGEDAWMVPLNEVLVGSSCEETAKREYKGLIYYRGALETDRSRAVIPESALREEEARGFNSRGAFTRRLAYLVNGGALGTEEFIRSQLEQLTLSGRYTRRKNPTTYPEGLITGLREQRGNAVHH